MAKTTIKNLVSLILEQIDGQNRVNEIFPLDQDVLVDDLRKYPELFIPLQTTGQQGAERPTIQMTPEPEMDAVADRELEPEYQMVAEGKGFEYEEEHLEEAIRIPANTLTLGPKTPELPRIVCRDPETDELVEGMVIGNLVLITPSGRRALVFYNEEAYDKVDRPSKDAWYVVLAEEGDAAHNRKYQNRLFKDKLRGQYWGKEVPRDVRHKLAIPVPGETDEEKDAREKRLNTIMEMMGKRYNIFPTINEMFSDHDVLDHLDSTLIPETWATSKRTEHTTNRVIYKKFGGSTPEIDVDFISVRDLKNVDEAIDDVMNLRADLALGADVDEKRQRETSKGVPRQHANYIYSGGNWHSKQRVHDPNFFRREGGKTPVYKLLSKNIQEGLQEISVESRLNIKGDVVGQEYVLTGTFTAKLNARNQDSGAGQYVGDLLSPINVGMRKDIPETLPDGEQLDPANLNIDTFPEFFVNQGRTTDEAPKDGYFKDFLELLGKEIIQNVDPDEVLERMVQIVQNAVDQEAENV